MLLRRLKIAGLLSFGPEGIDLPLERLNVLIGANGAGKSNFIEAIDILRSPLSVTTDRIARGGGVPAWLWQGPGAPDRFTIEGFVDCPSLGTLRHRLALAGRDPEPTVLDESPERSGQGHTGPTDLSFIQPPVRDEKLLTITGPHGVQRQAIPIDREESQLDGDSCDSNSVGSGAIEVTNEATKEVADRSLLPRHPARNDSYVPYLASQYDSVRIYRDWRFGPSSPLRHSASMEAHTGHLNEDLGNLPLALSNIRNRLEGDLEKRIQTTYDGILDIHFTVSGEVISFSIKEFNGRVIPASRLSDGTLKYLSLLAILLHPQPPRLVVIEQPELGLHTDLLRDVARLLVDASSRAQVIATTHSHLLVDFLEDELESIVVCEQWDGQTRMERLDRRNLGVWLRDYSLGEAWSKGAIGANRW